ncbi:hypothetical protein LXA43DRAFT_248326 [Ganoderma leucocontextum]|nr:hypothetical protein LXA43DRAFT_248326 [Ganoderma leucocontextum]
MVRIRLGTPSFPHMASNVSCRRDSDSIIIPSDSDEDMTSQASPPSGTGAKRKAPGPLGSQPPQKRSTVSQPAQGVRSKATSQDPPRDPRFWYPDGNAVIKVEQTYFKLFRSRLTQQCRYFQKLFTPSPRNQPGPSSSTNALCTGIGNDAPCNEVDGCTIYEVPGIELSDFATFLEFLEYPLEHSVSTAPEDTLYALLRASDVLGCDLVHGLAKQTVARQWLSLQPPGKDSILVVSGRRRTEGAVQAIAHARKYHIRGVLKRAFYDLLRNPTFWDAVGLTHTNSGVARAEVEQRCSADRKMLAPLSRGDIVRLQQARWELREAWDVLLHTPPGSDAGWKGTTCSVCPHGRPRSLSREDAWAVELAHAGERVSFRDPITRTYCIEEWLDSLKRASEGKWCDGCLEERKFMWREARTGWWQKLDGWLQTGEGASVVRVGSDVRGSNHPRRLLLI